MKPSLGRIVLVRIGTDRDGKPVYRPAIIVNVWSDTCINVQIFFDGTNDAAYIKEFGLGWLTSIVEGAGVGEWMWPPRT